MLEIEVVLSAGWTDEGTQTLRFPYEEGLIPAIVADRINISRDLVGMISGDGCIVEWIKVIHPNQRVCFFPYLAGG
jgi:hypothetical protein